MITVTRLFSWRPSGLSEPSGLRFGQTRLARAETGCCQICRGQLLAAHEPCLDRRGASLRQALIISVLTQRIGVAADSDTPVRLGPDEVGQIMQRDAASARRSDLSKSKRTSAASVTSIVEGVSRASRVIGKVERGLRERQALFREGNLIMRHADRRRDRRSSRGRSRRMSAAATSPPARASFAPRRLASRRR